MFLGGVNEFSVFGVFCRSSMFLEDAISPILTL